MKKEATRKALSLSELEACNGVDTGFGGKVVFILKLIRGRPQMSTFL